jgi:uncharacterized iron-regulated membrane protein
MNKLRRIVFWLHLAAGVTAGLVILVMSVTGVVLSFERQWLEAADVPKVSAAPQGTARLSVEELLEKAAAAGKPGAPLTSLSLSSDASMPVVASWGREATAYFHPQTGAALEAKAPDLRRFLRTVTDVHRWLAMPADSRNAGRAVTGAANLLFLFLVVSGLWLWLPRTWSWQALRPILWFRRKLSGRSRDWNWHNVCGIWSALPLLAIVVSGIVISYPWAGGLLFRLAGESPPPARTESPAPSAAPNNSRADRPPPDFTGLNAAWARAEASSSGWQSISLRLPAEKEAVFTIMNGHRGRPDLRSVLTIETKTGSVLKVENAGTQSTGQKLRAWLRWIHTGEAGGLAGQSIAALASAGATVLAITGLLLAGRKLAGRYRFYSDSSA